MQGAVAEDALRRDVREWPLDESVIKDALNKSGRLKVC